MRTVIRAGVLIVGAMAAGVGGWTAYFPRSFYEDVPTVDWTPPYSEHLFRDFGGASLGLALVLIAAAVWLERRIVILALAAYLLWSGPHLVFHAGHLHEDSAWSVPLMVGLVLMVLVPLLLIIAAAKALPDPATPTPRDPAAPSPRDPAAPIPPDKVT
jgi:hypothetical protein